MSNIKISKDLADELLIIGCGGGLYHGILELIDAGADIDAQNGGPLWNAVNSNYFTGVEILLNAGADVNAGQGQALIAAAINRCEPIVKLLLSHGAMVNADAVKMVCNDTTPEGRKIFDLLLSAMEKQVSQQSPQPAPAP